MAPVVRWMSLPFGYGQTQWLVRWWWNQWERGPYWIDGLLPLAYILDDDVLKAKVQPWIEWALQSQREDGFFGPEKDYPGEPGLQRDNSQDWWPRMVVLKILQQYYSATNDKRVVLLWQNISVINWNLAAKTFRTLEQLGRIPCLWQFASCILAL